MRTPSSTENSGKLYPALAGLLLLLLVVSLGACSVLEEVPGLEFSKVDNLQIGMIESSGLNSTEARFHTLTGRKTWGETLQEGDTFSLDYEADVEKGSLTLRVENPQDEVIWEKTVAEGESAGEQIDLAAGESGTYTIAVVGDGAGGSYELAWTQAN